MGHPVLSIPPLAGHLDYDGLMPSLPTTMMIEPPPRARRCGTAEVRHRGAHCPDVAHELELQALVPLVVGQLLEEPAGRAAGVGHADVQPSEGLRSGVDDPVRVVRNDVTPLP